jgi:hypothetical protein
MTSTKGGKSNLVVVDVMDIRSAKLDIVSNWHKYTPEKILDIYREHYVNLRTLSVMISRLKKELSRLSPPPSEEYLSQLALEKQEYNRIRAQAMEVREKEALNAQVIANSDEIVSQALKYLITTDPNLLYAALVVVTGLRPIEVVRVAMFSTKLNNQQEHPEWWACQSRFAKRGTMKTKYNPCRDRCFLAPFCLVARALKIVRQHWPTKSLSNVQVNRKYNTNWLNILQKAYPQVPGCTAKLLRRFFASYAYHYFSKGFFLNNKASQSSQVGFSSWMLGHANLQDQIIAYTSLVLEPEPKLNLFEVGRQLTDEDAKRK